MRQNMIIINRQKIAAGYLLILAAASFSVAWILMPGPGTTDAVHILIIVGQSRDNVLYSVITQLFSSVLYTIALLFLARLVKPEGKTLAGIILLGIGAMGLCADAFFHLLAWFMTGNTITINKDVVSVMAFMQKDGLAFLAPLLISFFTGSYLLPAGLYKQGVTSRIPQKLFLAALAGIILVVALNFLHLDSGKAISVTILVLIAASHAWTGFQLMNSKEEYNKPVYSITGVN